MRSIPCARRRDALLNHLPKDLILARYAVAGEMELVSGKFANPESSAALVANAFGLFATRTSSQRRIELDQQLRRYCGLDTFAMVRIWATFAGHEGLMGAGV